MKGKLFKSKPLPPKNEVLEYFATQGKPWKHPSEKYYTWHSSIPDKWVSIKGSEFFKHSSQLRYPRLSIELLQNTRKYASEFRSSSQESITKIMPSQLIPEESPRKTVYNMPERRLSLPISHKSPDKSFLITGGSSPNFFTKYPNTVKEIRSSSQNNNRIEEFLKRFENKQGAKEHPQANKGLLGWKLRHIKKKQEKKIDYCKVFNVKRHSDNPFSHLNYRRMRSTE